MIEPDYNDIPLYNNVFWSLISESCHILLISPSGAGKTMLLSFLGAMVLKRKHKLYLIDGKQTSFGATFRSVGIQTATTPSEIINMLSYLVKEMEKLF